MKIFKRGGGDQLEPSGEEREMPNFSRRDVTSLRTNGGDVVANNVSTLVERVSISSVQEIDRIIAELNGLKQRLQQESDRVAREISEFATLSQGAMQSTKVIAEGLTNFRAARAAATGAPADEREPPRT
jgi:hypothetical protein